MEHKIFAVSQINQYIKQQLDGDLLLQDLCISGELSNYKIYPSGHHYFTLKDAEGALRAVMFRGLGISTCAPSPTTRRQTP